MDAKLLFKNVKEELNIINKSNFLDAVKALQEKECDAIFGPKGGILILDERNCLVYKYNKKQCIYFSAENYLGEWRWIKD